MFARRIAIPFIFLICVINGWADTEQDGEDFEIWGYLYEGRDGKIWVARPMRIHGAGPYRQPPYYYHFRLGPETEKKFSSLTSPINTPHELGDEDLTVIVHLKGSARMVEKDSPERTRGDPSGTEDRVYEVDSAHLVDAEFITAGWREAWAELDGLFKLIPAATLTPPGEEKRRHLQRLIDEASRALNRMADTEPREEWRELVQGIDSDAALTTAYQEAARQEWGPPVRWCTEWLGIEPATPIPEEFRSEDVISRIAPSDELLEPVTVEDIGIVVRFLDQEALHEKLILGGYLVEEVLPGGQNPGFVVGDIIPARTSWYQVFCGSLDALPCAQPVDAQAVRKYFTEKLKRARQGREDLMAFRGDRVITLQVEGE